MKHKAFTLVELLFVIAIIALLISIETVTATRGDAIMPTTQPSAPPPLPSLPFDDDTILNVGIKIGAISGLPRSADREKPVYSGIKDATIAWDMFHKLDHVPSRVTNDIQDGLNSSIPQTVEQAAYHFAIASRKMPEHMERLFSGLTDVAKLRARYIASRLEMDSPPLANTAAMNARIATVVMESMALYPLTLADKVVCPRCREELSVMALVPLTLADQDACELLWGKMSGS